MEDSKEDLEEGKEQSRSFGEQGHDRQGLQSCQSLIVTVLKVMKKNHRKSRLDNRAAMADHGSTEKDKKEAE